MVPSWFGTEVCDRDGLPVGAVVDVYCDEASCRPAWLLVDDGARLALVPATGGCSRRGAIVLCAGRAAVDASPAIARPPQVLTGEPLMRLARHYGVRIDRFGACRALRGTAVGLAA
jgi:PRC-barrel domain